MRNVPSSPASTSSRAIPLRSAWNPFDVAIMLFMAALLFAVFPLGAQQGDAQRGKEMLQSRRCTQCHPIAGAGGGSAPDLGRRAPGEISPASLAADMWNHGPRMWKNMQ